MTISNAAASDAVMHSLAQQDTRFFRRFSWVILAFVIIAFGGKAIFDTADLPPITLMHHFHAVSMGSWFVLFALQATLTERGNVALHRTLGRFSPIVVITFLIFAAIISKLNWLRMGEPLIVTANTINILLFLGFYTTAILKRRDTDSHKRLMVFATLAIMGPAAGRIPETFDANVFFAVPISFAFIFTPLVYDRFFRRKVHRATIIGTVLLISSIPILLTLSGLAEWISVLETVMGPRGPAK